MPKIKQDKTSNSNRKLTAKEERFCYEYCLDFNATKAALRAGYSPKTGYSIGFENLRKPEIQKRIKEKQDNLAELAGISALRIVKEHEKIAFLNTGKMRDGWFSPTEFEMLTDDEKACIQEVTTKPSMFGDSLKVKLYDKQKSLDSLANILGFNAAIKNELTGKDGKDLLTGPDLTKLSDAELKIYHALLVKTIATAE